MFCFQSKLPGLGFTVHSPHHLVRDWAGALVIILTASFFVVPARIGQMATAPPHSPGGAPGSSTPGSPPGGGVRGASTQGGKVGEIGQTLACKRDMYTRLDADGAQPCFPHALTVVSAMLDSASCVRNAECGVMSTCGRRGIAKVDVGECKGLQDGRNVLPFWHVLSGSA